MSDLQSVEQMQFETLFGMESGVVLDFSNAKFRAFVYEHTNLDIYDDKYNIQGESKAKRLRSFIKLEDNYIVAKVLDKLLEVWVEKQLRINYVDDIEEIEDKVKLRIYRKCKNATSRLNENSVDVEALETEEEDFSMLVSQIKMSIESGQVEGALDRLHTYMHKYARKLCTKYNLIFVKEDTINSLFNKYKNYLNENNLIESKMTITILRNNASILNDFNNVRNEKSLAHDNDVLNYDESVYILNTIIALKVFIDSIEER